MPSEWSHINLLLKVGYYWVFKPEKSLNIQQKVKCNCINGFILCCFYRCH